MQVRKFRKSMWFAAVLYAAPIVAFVPGCSGGNSSLGNTVTPTPTSTASLTVAQLVGTYRETSISARSGERVTCPGRIDSINEACGPDERIVIASTGTNSGTLDYPPILNDPRTVRANFTLSGNIMTLQDEGEAETFQVALNGNTLTLIQIEDGITFTFTKL